MKNQSAAVARRLADPEFQQRMLRRSFLSNTILTGAVLALVGDRIWRDHHPPTPQYFYTDGKGTPREVYPLDQPVMSDADLIIWTVSSVAAVFSINFKDYRTQLNRAAEHFTDRGWIAFANAFKGVGNFEQIKRARLVGSATPERSAVINSQGIVGDLYTYKIEIPMIVAFENDNVNNDNQHLMVSVVVVRTIAPDHPDGIAIDQIVIVPS